MEKPLKIDGLKEFTLVPNFNNLLLLTALGVLQIKNFMGIEKMKTQRLFAIVSVLLLLLLNSMGAQAEGSLSEISQSVQSENPTTPEDIPAPAPRAGTEVAPPTAIPQPGGEVAPDEVNVQFNDYQSNYQVEEAERLRLQQEAEAIAQEQAEAIAQQQQAEAEAIAQQQAEAEAIAQQQAEAQIELERQAEAEAIAQQQAEAQIESERQTEAEASYQTQGEVLLAQGSEAVPATHSASVAVQPQNMTFMCGDSNGVPATIAKGANGDSIPIILWKSIFFKPSGYDPQTRCKQVSARFEAYNQDKAIKYVTAGKLNGQAVVCLTGTEDGECGDSISLNKGLLFTLQPSSDLNNLLNTLAALIKGDNTSEQKAIEL